MIRALLIAAALLLSAPAYAQHFGASGIAGPATGTNLNTGQPGVGYISFTGAVSDTDTVTINSRVYEFDSDATFTGDVQVDVSGGGPDLTADAAVTALVTAINADASASVYAAATGAGDDTVSVCYLVEKSVGAASLSLAKSGTNIAVSAAATTGFDNQQTQIARGGSYTVTAADITLRGGGGGDSGIAVGGWPSTTAPRATTLSAYSPTDGTIRAIDGRLWIQAGSGLWLLVVFDSGATLSASDKIDWIAVGDR